MSNNIKISSSKIANLIKDFNLLVTITEEQKKEYEPFQISKISEIYEAQLIFNQTGQRYHIYSSIDQFKFLGTGVYLLFKYIQFVGKLFFILCIFGLINIWILYSNKGIFTDVELNNISQKMVLTTIGNANEQTVKIIGMINFLNLIFVSCVVIYWKQNESQEIISCSKIVLLPSYYTVILQKIPEDYNEEEIKLFLQKQFGSIKYINTVRQLRNDLVHYKKINEIVSKYKIERSKLKIDGFKINNKKFINLFYQFYSYYYKIKQIKRQKYALTFAFITFQSIKTRQQLLQTYKSRIFNKCNKHKQANQNLKYKGQQLKFKRCDFEPDSIIWKNISLKQKDKIFRFTCQICLLLLILLLSVSIIFVLSLCQFDSNPKYLQIVSNKTKYFFDGQFLKEYCLSLDQQQFENEIQKCWQYSSEFKSRMIVTLVLPIIISLLKFLFVKIMNLLSEVRRYYSQIQKIQYQAVITFIFYFIISGFLQIIIHLKIQVDSQNYISIVKILNPLLLKISNLFIFNPDKIPSFTSFSKDWFVLNSSKIILISLLSFNISTVFNLLYSILRKAICFFKATTRIIFKQASECLKPQIFQIEFNYAFVLHIVYFSLILGGAIPLLWIFGFLSIILFYWVQKYIFVKYCAKPLVFGHKINHLITRMTFIAIIFSTITYPIFYSGVIQNQKNKMDNFIDFYYYFILTFLIVIYMFFKRYMLSAYQTFKRYLYNHKIFSNSIFAVLDKIQIKNNLVPYSMYENNQYKQILKNLQTINLDERNRNTFLINDHLNNFFYQSRIKSKKQQPFNELYQLISENERNEGIYKKYERLFKILDRKIELIKQLKEQNDKKIKIFDIDSLDMDEQCFSKRQSIQNQEIIVIEKSANDQNIETERCLSFKVEQKKTTHLNCFQTQ